MNGNEPDDEDKYRKEALEYLRAERGRTIACWVLFLILVLVSAGTMRPEQSSLDAIFFQFIFCGFAWFIGKISN